MRKMWSFCYLCHFMVPCMQPFFHVTENQYQQSEVANCNLFSKCLCYDRHCNTRGMFAENRIHGFDARERKLGDHFDRDRR